MGWPGKRWRQPFFGAPCSATADRTDRIRTRGDRVSGQLADAVQERGPFAQENGHAAAQIRDRPEFADDHGAVPEDVLRGDDAADRHLRSWIAVRKLISAIFVPATGRLLPCCPDRSWAHSGVAGDKPAGRVRG